MMERNQNFVTRLYPDYGQELPLEGLYLAQDLRTRAAPGMPFVYGNYVTSLDGRIAVPHPTRPGLTVPAAIANDRDWRLFQELAVQADVLLTSGRYLRDVADGRAQEILRSHDDPRFSDLARWRVDHGLPRLPDLAVISASLDFPVPEALTAGGRRVFVVTTRRSDPRRRQGLAARAELILAGDESVDGGELVQELSERGAQLIYNATGPRVHHLLLAAGVIQRLYLTHTQRALGGEPFSSIVEGPLLDPPVDFRLAELYLDLAGMNGRGQMFAVYDR